MSQCLCVHEKRRVGPCLGPTLYLIIDELQSEKPPGCNPRRLFSILIVATNKRTIPSYH